MDNETLQVSIRNFVRAAGGRGTTVAGIIAALPYPRPNGVDFTAAINALVAEGVIVVQAKDNQVFDAERWRLLQLHRATAIRCQSRKR